ncbi:MAG: DUF1559 domain-containing protein [Planctomycetales bacterium]|nr:DUF1559 domain-containing protein [Planctomycetales bacterium]
MLRTKTFLLAWVATFVAAQGVATAQSVDIAEGVAPWIDGESLVVATVRLDGWQLDRLAAIGGEFAPDLKTHIDLTARDVERVRDELVAAGFRQAAIVVSMHDMFSEEPIAVLVKTPHSDVKRLRNLLAQAKPLMARDFDRVVVVGRPEVLDRLAAGKPTPRPALTEALSAAGDAPLKVCLLPTDDQRRVVDELMPTLPPYLGNEPSTALTRGVLWLAVGVDGPPQAALRVTVQSADEASAASLLRVWNAGVKSLLSRNDGPEGTAVLQSLLALIAPQQQGSQLTFSLGGDRDANEVIQAVTPPIQAMRNEVLRRNSMNNLKMLMLGLLNFESANKRLPATATFDATGQPLLSWRVHILPYLEEGELYRKFHLDEPWDSPHNKALLAEMPDVFRCPASHHRAASGLATYREVVGENTVWPERVGVLLRDISDGMSQTIALVEVDDEHAVPWTKPGGLEFDPQGPPEGIGGQFPGGFNAAFCDGHVRFMAVPAEADTIVPLLTRNGEEVIELP